MNDKTAFPVRGYNGIVVSVGMTYREYVAKEVLRSLVPPFTEFGNADRFTWTKPIAQHAVMLTDALIEALKETK